MGPPALDMLERYRVRGIEIPPFLKDHPDHIALLLEYGGLLCEANDPGLPDFVASHLDGWIETFGEEVCAATESPFYRAVAATTVAFAQYERRHTGEMEARA